MDFLISKSLWEAAFGTFIGGGLLLLVPIFYSKGKQSWQEYKHTKSAEDALKSHREIILETQNSVLVTIVTFLFTLVSTIYIFVIGFKLSIPLEEDTAFGLKIVNGMLSYGSFILLCILISIGIYIYKIRKIKKKIKKDKDE